MSLFVSTWAVDRADARELQKTIKPDLEVLSDASTVSSNVSMKRVKESNKVSGSLEIRQEQTITNLEDKWTESNLEDYSNRNNKESEAVNIKRIRRVRWRSLSVSKNSNFTLSKLRWRFSLRRVLRGANSVVSVYKGVRRES